MTYERAMIAIANGECVARNWWDWGRWLEKAPGADFVFEHSRETLEHGGTSLTVSNYKPYGSDATSDDWIIIDRPSEE